MMTLSIMMLITMTSSIMSLSVMTLNIMILSIISKQNLANNIQQNKNSEAVFLVMCDPSMNEL
jgi:hypothetical protein